MSNVAFINNKYVHFKDAKIHIEDRGFQFSDSVYEVIKVINNKLLDIDFHIRRLKYSIKELNFNYKVNQLSLTKIFTNLVIKNNLKNGIIYLQITRGIQPRSHAYKKGLKPNVIIYTAKKKYNLPNKNFKGFKAITYPDIRWGRPDIKTTSLLANILAATEASKKGAYETILVKGNKVTEAAHSNVWMIKSSNIITHPANREILNGVTRTILINIINSLNLKFIEKEFTLNELFKSDEVFVTSASSLVTPITHVDKIKIKNGKIGAITKSLALNLYKAII